MKNLTRASDLESLKTYLILLRANSALNEWESGFVDDMFERFFEDGDISDRQLEIINDIWVKYA